MAHRHVLGIRTARFLVCICTLLAAVGGSGVARAASPAESNVRSPDRVSYTLELTSDAKGITWTGTESVTFTNVSSKAMATVWIRLWDNGIDGCTNPLPVQVSNVTGGTAGELQVGCSALPVTMPSPLNQGDQATLAFDLSISVPMDNWRFGRIGPMSLVGNAVPLLAVRDGRGWQLDPSTNLGESFYSVDGDFQVTFHAPENLKVPATGEIKSARTEPNGTITTTYVAKGVRDFAWASGPLNELDGTSSTGVTIRVWWPNSISLSQAQRALDVAKQAMPFHAGQFGPYLYGEVDVVLGLFTGFGGMEYPQFVMVQPSDGALVHELAHQWWYGMVGDDQWREPWIDEAFASYSTDIFYRDFGQGCGSIPWPSPTARISNSMAYWTTHSSEYGTVVYLKGSCALHDLSKLIGPKVMQDFLRTYNNTLKLDFSTTRKFQTVAQLYADRLPNPIDLTPFWELHRIGKP